MIRFALVCPDDHEFEGWFKSNAAYEEQVAQGELTCPVCGSGEIRKAVMAPAITRGAAERVPAPAPAPAQPAPAASVPAATVSPAQAARFAEWMRLARAVQAHVRANFEDVGDKFAEEARRIHLGERDEADIYGQATREEVEELAEDGIAVAVLPQLPELDS